MRQPATPSPLEILVAALPDAALRPLLIELLQNGAAPKALPVPATPTPAKRPGGWPAGKKRGRPRKAAAAAAALARQRERDAALKREKRAAAKTTNGDDNGTETTTNGADPRGRRREQRRERDRARHAAKAAAIGPAGAVAAAAEAASAKTLWQHAALLQPKAPWRAIVREFGINEAVALDAHRVHKLPPGITGDAVTRFMAVPAG
jgi:hypothetical protein